MNKALLEIFFLLESQENIQYPLHPMSEEIYMSPPQCKIYNGFLGCR